MFQSNWFRYPAFFVIVSIFIFLPFLGALADEQSQQNGANQQQAGATLYADPNSLIETANSNRSTSANRASGESQSEYAPTPRHWFLGDSPAQWMMATVTLLATILVWRTLVVTGGMLREARKATHAAIRAGRAASKTSEITREIGQKQVRAYLDSEGFQAHHGPKGTSLVLRLKNYGASPANEIQATVEYGIYSNGTLIGDDLPIYFPMNLDPLPPAGESTASVDLILTAQMISDLRAGDMEIRVKATVRYYTVFQENGEFSIGGIGSGPNIFKHSWPSIVANTG